VRIKKQFVFCSIKDDSEILLTFLKFPLELQNFKHNDARQYDDNCDCQQLRLAGMWAE